MTLSDVFDVNKADELVRRLKEENKVLVRLLSEANTRITQLESQCYNLTIKLYESSLTTDDEGRAS
jgi:predicted RNase H-like nuclease (RuvC/YqgF family)